MDEYNKDNKEEKKDNPQGENKDFVFMREQIKSRPINNRKLARTTLISAVSALVFGLVACVTFFVLAPIVSGYLEKDEEVVEEEPVKPVVFPEETLEEEMNPEDMMITSEPEIDLTEIAQLEEEEITKIVESIEFGVVDYQNLYARLSEIAFEAEKSLVRVRTVTTETDWFDNMFEETSEISGLVVANNETNIYILTYASKIKEADEVYVTFPNDISVRAELQMMDSCTDLCVLAIPLSGLNEATKASFAVATLGSSNSSKLAGSLIMAIGSPMGNFGSLNYGMITASNTELSVSDRQYRKMTTDIYGSTKATGVLINLKGEVIGIIDTKFPDEDVKNLISAIGISEMKKTLEKMINNQPLIYTGMKGANVPNDALYLYRAPRGAFILSVDMDSPAMNGGIQAGDIVVEISGKLIGSYIELVAAVRDMEPDTPVSVTVSRLSQEGYKNLDFEIIPEVLQ